MTLHKDSVVQLTHDLFPQTGVTVPRGTAGRVLSRVAFRRASVVEFTLSDEQTAVVRVHDFDLAEVRPNARV
jgi:hypothetical protein